jgi:hypothetical protein
MMVSSAIVTEAMPLLSANLEFGKTLLCKIGVQTLSLYFKRVYPDLSGRITVKCPE